MSGRLKLGLEITGFILIVLLLAWGIWAVFFRQAGTSIIPAIVQEPITGLPATEVGTGGRVVDTGQSVPRTLIPEPAAGKLELDTVAAGGRTRADAITSTRALYSTVSGNGMLQYYDRDEGLFYRMSPNGGEPILLSDEIFRGVDNVVWSHAGDGAILEFPDGANIYYNFESKERATLPKVAREFSFSPQDEQIAYEYIGENPDDRWIIESGANGQGQRIISSIGSEPYNLQINWSPNNQMVATFRDVTSSAGEEVFFLGFNNENYLSLQTNGIGFEGKWSPTGRQILYSVYSEGTNYNPVLYIAVGEGEDIGLGNRSLKIQTWPDKCVFAGESELYCAVPQYLDLGTGIFREQAAGTPDTIYRVDLERGVSTPIAFPETEGTNAFTIETLNIAKDNSELYFTDTATGKIRRLRLR